MAVDGFLTPIISVLIAPREGFPRIANLYLWSPGKLLMGVNSLIGFNVSSKYKVFPSPNCCKASALSFVRTSMGTSSELESGFQTSSAESLLELLSV